MLRTIRALMLVLLLPGLPALAQDDREFTEEARKKYAAELREAAAFIKDRQFASAQEKLDALIVPSGGPSWMIDLVNGDSSNWDMESTSPAAVAGYPHITVPAGYLFGLPVGISFFSSAWQEPALIKFAYAFEQATQFRRQPRFLPTAGLTP